MNIESIPNLSADVALPGACALDETAGPVCFGVGVVIGIAINKAEAAV